MTRWPLIRDIGCFAIGAAGFLHEVFLTQIERPWLALIAAGLMGLPVFLPGGVADIFAGKGKE